MDPLFQYHKLNECGQKKAKAIAEVFDNLLARLTDVDDIGLTHNRELSIVKSKLEEACFYAKKAMASLEENQEGYQPPSEPHPPF